MPVILLDYGMPNPFGEIFGGKRYLAWPVNAYRVTLPNVPNSGFGLNAFERVVLKLIDVGGVHDPSTLAAETCMPMDLIQCVLLRLRDQAFIDEYNQIVSTQRKAWAYQTIDTVTYATAILFRELVTGKILPYLHFLSVDKPLKNKEVEEGKVRQIRWNLVHRDCLPTARDVISALRMMQKRSVEFRDEVCLPPANMVTLAVDPEMCLLDCPIAILRSDGEFRIADPFGNGYSLILENAFSRVLESDSGIAQWMMNWKKNLSNPSPSNEEVTVIEPFDSEANRKLYPKLVSNLKLKRNQQFRSISQIHAAIEWALYYSCVRRACDTALYLLDFEDFAEHPTLLQNAALDLAFNVPKGGFHFVPKGKIQAFRSGKAELDTVMSLSLLMAAGDASHPLRRMASLYPDMINRLFEIKDLRDDHGHGQGGVRLKEFELPEEAFMRDMISTLLPTIKFSGTHEVVVGEETIHDATLDARTGIQEEFGFARYNRFGTNLQDRLICAERFWLSCKDGDDGLPFVCDLYAALQMMCRSTLSGALPPAIEDVDYIDSAGKKAAESGLGALPKCISTVKRSAVRSTLQGNDQSLQSCVVAYILISDSESLRSIAHTHPTFFSDLGIIIEHRGHGNESIIMSKDEIRQLRKLSFTCIQTLLEA